MKTYTEEEIKKVFWKIFHKSGELWFPYFGPENEDNEVTEFYWNEFLRNLSDMENEFVMDGK